MPNPLFFSGVNNRPVDENIDLLEAEDLYREWAWMGDWLNKWDFECPECFDLDQAVEIIAVQPGWLYGEKFYAFSVEKNPENDWTEFDFESFVSSVAVQTSMESKEAPQF